MLRPGIFGADFFEYTISAFEIHSFTPFWQGLNLLIGFLDSGCFRPNSFWFVLLFRFPFISNALNQSCFNKWPTNGMNTLCVEEPVSKIKDIERVVIQHIVLQTNS